VRKSMQKEKKNARAGRLRRQKTFLIARGHHEDHRLTQYSEKGDNKSRFIWGDKRGDWSFRGEEPGNTPYVRKTNSHADAFGLREMGGSPLEGTKGKQTEVACVLARKRAREGEFGRRGRKMPKAGRRSQKMSGCETERL